MFLEASEDEFAHEVARAQVVSIYVPEQVNVPEMAVLQQNLGASWRWQSACEMLNSAAQPGNLFTALPMGRRAASWCTQQCVLTGRHTGGPLAGIGRSVRIQAITTGSQYSLLAGVVAKVDRLPPALCCWAAWKTPSCLLS